MHGSDGNWPAQETTPEASTSRTGGSRMLLDELVAQRDGSDEALPLPALAIEPVAVAPAGDVSRRAARQRLIDLEQAARRNFRSAEEARRALLEEHNRLQEESSARAKAQGEASALRREVDRLRSVDDKRAAQAKNRASRAAREEIAEELKSFHDEHARVVHELEMLQGALRDHDGLIEDYAAQLRNEQQARAAMQVEVERAEAARNLAERSLERATELAQRHAEDEMIQLATAQSELADAKSDRDRLAKQLEELTTGEGPVARLQDQVRERDDEIVALNETIASMQAQIDGLVADQQTQADAAAADRAAAEERLEQEQAAHERARADGDQLRAHAAALGDELAALRATVAELQAAASAQVREPLPAPAPMADPLEKPEPEPDRPPLARREKRVDRPAPPPLPVRRPEPVVAEPVVAEPVVAEPVAAEPVAAEVVDPFSEPAAEPEPALVPAASIGSEELLPVRSNAKKSTPDNGVRRTAMAELAGIASSGDDFSYRRR